jgi:hypothetical protein
MIACDRGCIVTNARKGYVWPERPFIRLSISFKECCAQRCDFIGSGTVGPEQAGSSRLRAVADTLEHQPECAKLAGYQAKLLNSFRDGCLAPRRHERQVDISGCDQPHRLFLQAGGNLGEFMRNLSRDLDSEEYASWRRSQCIRCCGVP